MNTISITTSQNIELEYELGSLGDRILARILDGVIVGAYVVVVIILFNAIGISMESNLWLLLILFLPIVFYDVLCEMMLNGQSFGKRIMSIRVISANGEQPTTGQYFIRWLFRLIDFTLSGSLVALITVAVTEKKQRLGDIIAGTVVIKTTARTQLAHTMYTPNEQAAYTVTYPEVLNLGDADIQLVKEVILAVSRTGNTMLALHTQQKIEQVLHIASRNSEPIYFLQTILADYNYPSSQDAH